MSLDTGGKLYEPEDYSSKDIIKFLINNLEVDFIKHLILNSEKYLHEEELRLAILEIIMALEIKISGFTLNKLEEYNLGKSNRKDFLIKTGLSNQIKVLLNFYQEIYNKDIPKSIVNDAIGAITIRNKIIHEGLKNANMNKKDIERKIKNVKRLINHIQQLGEE